MALIYSIDCFIDFVWRLAAEQTWTVRTAWPPASGHRGARGAEPPPRCISSQLLSINVLTLHRWEEDQAFHRSQGCCPPAADPAPAPRSTTPAYDGSAREYGPYLHPWISVGAYIYACGPRACRLRINAFDAAHAALWGRCTGHMARPICRFYGYAV